MATITINSRHKEWHEPPPDIGALGKQLAEAEIPSNTEAAAELANSAVEGESDNDTVARFLDDPANADKFKLVRAQRDEIIATFGEGSKRLEEYDRAVLQAARDSAGVPTPEPQHAVEMTEGSAGEGGQGRVYAEMLNASAAAWQGTEAGLPKGFRADGKALMAEAMRTERDDAQALLDLLDKYDSPSAVMNAFFSDEANAGKLEDIARRRELLIAKHGADSPQVRDFDAGVVGQAERERYVWGASMAHPEVLHKTGQRHA